MHHYHDVFSVDWTYFLACIEIEICSEPVKSEYMDIVITKLGYAIYKDGKVKSTQLTFSLLKG